ncbi:conserved hypothetical protein [Ricinus communis]|uniref:Uncharacterized protein n=1 Tax=Ricinus communis TaxID=3988 RepID=B9RUM1_RICCO|nr:conserved hypothetical protein [Ricinus communis]|eukprot:XP_025012805.1 uncharacterized protein LOC112534589 [Ricinus communis]
MSTKHTGGINPSCHWSNCSGNFLENANYAHCVAYFFLTFNSITTTYRAYINNDTQMVVFIIFVYLGYFVLDFCITTYNQLPRNGEYHCKKEFLKVAIWSLTSAVLFGFGYQFSTFMSMSVVSLMYGVAIICSLFLFYVYFVCYSDGQNSDFRVCCNVESIVISHLSSSGRLTGDKNNKYGASPLENV